MKAETLQAEPELIGEAEYQTLEQTLMESDRGRRFLKEFLNRNKTPETTEILSSIRRLEKVVTRQRKVPDLDKIRLDIADMHEAIERTKSEIANIKDDTDQSNRFVDASHELDAIVTQTEGATQSILEAAEQIQEKAWVLRENGADDATCDDIDAKATEIFMACSFQDLTGQRTNKVVQVLRYLESRINLMINIWGIEDLEADDTAGPVDNRPDAHLLNGPQMAGAGVSQNSVDELMSVSGDVLDAALSDVAKEVSSEANDFSHEMGQSLGAADIDAIMAEDNQPMDAAAIDDMFAPAPKNEAVEEAPADEFSGDFDSVAGDEVLDEAAIDKLFDAEVADSEVETDEPADMAAAVESETVAVEDIQADLAAEVEAESEAASEAEADADWAVIEQEADSDDSADPLVDLTEAERQALFN
ncbi:protein phosphatase CheZ [Roseibium sp.]|uniref:protein phosphatase CheZ n=1 Tax=Roseibium sp. TaxID=1936156 RepID=UPI003B51D8F3